MRYSVCRLRPEGCLSYIDGFIPRALSRDTTRRASSGQTVLNSTRRRPMDTYPSESINPPRKAAIVFSGDFATHSGIVSESLGPGSRPAAFANRGTNFRSVVV